MRRLALFGFVCAIALGFCATAFADGDREKRFQVDVQIVTATLFPPGHPFHDPATVGLLRDDCTAMGWATFLGDGMGRASYIGAVKNEQSHCAELAPPGTGFPTGFFLNGEVTWIGEGTDSDGERDKIFSTYQPNLIPGINTGLAPWCNPMFGPCPFTGLGEVTFTGGEGRFSRMSGGVCSAWIVGSADGDAEVFSDCSIESQGPLPGSY